MLLRSPVPIVLLWNEDGVMIYNDAYSVFAGNRNPALLGAKESLPRADAGRQLAESVREMRPGHGILFITGYAENAVLNQGHIAPGMHAMTKPFAMDALASRIKDLVGE